MTTYKQALIDANDVISANGHQWSAIDPESVARMRLQNRFKTGLDIARYNAKIMREDMAEYDNDPSKYCLLYTSPSPRDKRQSRMPSSA